jgi:hypothetical protein
MRPALADPKSAATATALLATAGIMMVLAVGATLVQRRYDL